MCLFFPNVGHNLENPSKNNKLIKLMFSGKNCVELLLQTKLFMDLNQKLQHPYYLSP